MHKYEVLAGRSLSEDSWVTAMISLHMKDLKALLELRRKDMRYSELREYIISFVERRRDTCVGVRPLGSGLLRDGVRSLFRLVGWGRLRRLGRLWAHVGA